jgi:hypothetical protein
MEIHFYNLFIDIEFILIKNREFASPRLRNSIKNIFNLAQTNNNIIVCNFIGLI